MLDFDRFTLLINLIFEVSVFVLRWRDIKLWEQLDTQLPISWLLDFAHEFQKKKRFSCIAIIVKDYFTICRINCGALGFGFLFSFPMECTSIVTTFATIQLGLHGRSQLDEVQTPTLSLKSTRTHNGFGDIKSSL